LYGKRLKDGFNIVIDERKAGVFMHEVKESDWKIFRKRAQ